MERRGSNVDASTVRAARRRSAVTIIAPGEETNPFHPDTNNPTVAKSNLPTTARRPDAQRTNPREEETINRAPPPAQRTAQLPPRLSIAATSTPAPVAQPNPLIQPHGGNVNAPSSASNRMRGLHMFPNTPPTIAAAPPPRSVSVRGGNVLAAGGGGRGAVPARAAQFPTQPGASRGNAAAPAALPEGSLDQHATRPAVRHPMTTRAAPHMNPNGASFTNGQGQPSTARPRSITPRMDSSEGRETPLVSSQSNGGSDGSERPVYGPSATGRRGTLPFSQQQQEPQPATPSSARWVASARRQSLNASAPNVTTNTADHNSASGAGKASRRVTVPQAKSPSQPRVELVRVPRPPSRRDSLKDGDDDGASSSDRLSVSEAPSWLLKMGDSGSSVGHGSGTGSFSRLAGNGTETSVVIDDRLLDDEKSATRKKERAAEAVTTPSPQQQQQRRAAPLRVESPPADNEDFLRPTRRPSLAVTDMAPLSPQMRQNGSGRATAQHHRNKKKEDTSSSSRSSSSDEEEDVESASDSAEDREEEEGTGERSNPLRTPSSPSAHHKSKADASPDLQSTVYFSPVHDHRKAPPHKSTSGTKPAAGTKASDTSDTAAIGPEESVKSLADFGLTSNDTLEPASFPTSSTSSDPAVQRQRMKPAAVHLPSPVDLNTVLFRGGKVDPAMSSPVLSRNKHSGKEQSSSRNAEANAASTTAHRSERERRENSRDGSGNRSKSNAASENDNFETASVGNWSFDYLAKNGLSNDTQNSEVDVRSPRVSTFVGTVPASPAWSSVASPRATTKAAEEKWRVTQSLSINPSEFSFDHLPIEQQSSNVAKLRKVFESQRKPRREESNSAMTSESVRAAPQHAVSPVQVVRPAAATKKPTLDAVAASVGSTVMAPASEPSSGRSTAHDTDDEEAEDESGRNTLVVASVSAPVMDFSFDRLTPPASPAVKVTLPSIAKDSGSHPQQGRNSSTSPSTRQGTRAARTDTSESAFRFSWAASTDVGSPINRHSAPSGTTAMATKTTSGQLPSISLPGSEGGFSLARFQNSVTSVDTVNMFDHYEF